MAISYTAAPKAKMSARKSIWSALPSTCSGAPLLQVAKVAGRHGGKVADSLPSGSGNLDVQPLRKRLPYGQ